MGSQWRAEPVLSVLVLVLVLEVAADPHVER